MAAERGEAKGTAAGARKGELHRLAAAMAHPVRSKILFALTEKPGVTIRQVSARISETPRRVRYHLGKMVDEGTVAVEEERVRAGTIERRYRAARAPVIKTEEMEPLGLDLRRRMALEILKAVFADARTAIGAGTFGIHDGHIEVRWWAEVDREGWEELTLIHEDAFEEVSAALARIKVRIAAGGEPTMAMTAAHFLFEVPAWKLE